ncbi:MAG: beta-N-acetylhexosaminidase [Xanthomonadales bacterium]|nr:beta-N-acetylhexosaminidase [Xanthomonadales bacterium]
MNKAKQMSLGPVLIGVASTHLSQAEKALLGHSAVGGVVLFSRNIENAMQVSALCTDIRAQREARLLITIDQEGGRVQRLREGFSRLPALRSIGKMYTNDPDQARDYAYRHGRVMATEVLDLGIDLSFAPVVDLDCGSCVIADRSLGNNAEQVIELSRAYIAGMADAGMRACGKHYPGHGSVELDSHLDDVIDRRSAEEILSTDLKPFAALSPQLASIMVAHVTYPAVDKQPAGYSSRWLKQILREEIAYSGVIISDDLDMFAACNVGDMPVRVELALASGCDLVLICKAESAEEYLQQVDNNFADASILIQQLYGRSLVSRKDAQKVSEYRQWVATLEMLQAADANAGND